MRQSIEPLVNRRASPHPADIFSTRIFYPREQWVHLIILYAKQFLYINTMFPTNLFEWLLLP